MWERLVKLALLGAERTHLPENIRVILEDQGIDTNAPFPNILLEAAVMYHQFDKAAFFRPEWTDPLPDPVVADEQKSCSAASARHLRMILQGNYGQALPEFLQLLADHQLSLPAEALPPIFESAMKDSDFWRLVRPTIGATGHWLLALNPEWETLRENTNPSGWDTGTREERAAILRYLRQADPGLSLTLLERTWSQDSVTDKMAFLPIMETNLSIADEDFLEARLDDSRKEVRQKAAQLLARIEGSALQNRLIDQVSAILTYNGEKVDFKIPKELPDATVRDGIRPSPKKNANSLKSDWLQQLVGRIPPSWWENQLKREPRQIASLFARSRWGNILIPALTEATILHKDDDWREALLRYWQELGKEEEWHHPKGKQLMSQLSDTAFNRIILEQLEGSEALVEEHSLAGHLLCLKVRPWDNQVSKNIIRGFQKWLAGANAYQWNTWHYRRIFEVAAYSVSPHLLDHLKAGWNFKAAAWAQWDGDVERFLKTLAFRRDMHEGIK